MLQWFRDLKITHKLIIGFSSMLVIMIVVGISGFIGMGRTQGHLTEIYLQRLPSLDYILQADRDLYQLIVAERSMIFADVRSDVFQQFIADYEENMAQSAERWEKYKELNHTEAELPLIEKFDRIRAVWEVISRRIVEARSEDTRHGRQLAIDLSLSEGHDQFNEMRECLNQLTEIIVEQAGIENLEARRDYRNTVIIVSLVLLSGVLVGFVLMRVIGASVTRPVRKVVDMLHDIAQGQGDLTRRIDVESRDEMGELAKWFNLFVDKLHEIVRQLKIAANALAAASEEISSTAIEMATGAEEQNQQTSEVATSVQEVAAAIVLNSQNAHQTTDIARSATSRAKAGTDAMHDTQQGMEAIVRSVVETHKVIKALLERLEQISDVVWTIDDIAAQTKVLALNASIEAANAGEEGKGFAIVANEVRRLVLRTTEATQNIEDTLTAIQKEIQKSSESMDRVNEVVSQGKKAVVRAEGVFQEILESVSQAMSMIQQIATVSQEQSSGAEEISRSVSAISAVSQQSANGADQLAASARQLNLQTTELRALVNEFTIEAQAQPD
ncbi:MAG TPA: methyl-accepting chemotaxis protein [bacterium]|nr:methyl-accepting chemotaxis protein [bacterium]